MRKGTRGGLARRLALLVGLHACTACTPGHMYLYRKADRKFFLLCVYVRVRERRAFTIRCNLHASAATAINPPRDERAREGERESLPKLRASSRATSRQFSTLFSRSIRLNGALNHRDHNESLKCRPYPARMPLAAYVFSGQSHRRPAIGNKTKLQCKPFSSIHIVPIYRLFHKSPTTKTFAIFVPDFHAETIHRWFRKSFFSSDRL